MKLLVVSDIHANWSALQAILEAEPDPDRILCLGDLVNYGPQPAECVAWAQEILPPEWVIQGNHDYAAACNADPRCSTAYAPLAAATQEVTSRLLAPEAKEFLASLQPLRLFKLHTSKCMVCHASPSDPLYHWITARSPLELWESEVIAADQPDFLFLGHTHLPMQRRVGNTLVVNPGSVGQPRHGTPQAAYAVWNDGEVTLRRVPYDIEETLHAYRDLDLNPYSFTALRAILLFGAELSAHLIKCSLET
jgi:putative phosphoesterase